MYKNIQLSFLKERWVIHYALDFFFQVYFGTPGRSGTKLDEVPAAAYSSMSNSPSSV